VLICPICDERFLTLTPILEHLAVHEKIHFEGDICEAVLAYVFDVFLILEYVFKLLFSAKKELMLHMKSTYLQ
jgi:hypothetical protein